MVRSIALSPRTSFLDEKRETCNLWAVAGRTADFRGRARHLRPRTVQILPNLDLDGYFETIEKVPALGVGDRETSPPGPTFSGATWRPGPWWAANEKKARKIYSRWLGGGETAKEIASALGLTQPFVERSLLEARDAEARGARIARIGAITKTTSMEDFCLLLPTRIANLLLRKFGPRSNLEVLCNMTEEKFGSMPGVGEQMRIETRNALARFGLSFMTDC